MYAGNKIGRFLSFKRYSLTQELKIVFYNYSIKPELLINVLQAARESIGKKEQKKCYFLNF